MVKNVFARILLGATVLNVWYICSNVVLRTSVEFQLGSQNRRFNTTIPFSKKLMKNLSFNGILQYKKRGKITLKTNSDN
jgi:hypothetical protein